jgi:uncharacterized membrane protein (Fun14 family)
MFVFCLALPQLAFACMPMEGASGTQNLVSTLSFMLGLVYLASAPVMALRRRRLMPDTTAHARLTRHIALAWKIGITLIALPFAFTYGDMLMLSLLIIGFYAMGLAIVGVIRLAAFGVRKVNFNKIQNEKNYLTRRFAAEGDVT